MRVAMASFVISMTILCGLVYVVLCNTGESFIDNVVLNKKSKATTTSLLRTPQVNERNEEELKKKVSAKDKIFIAMMAMKKLSKRDMERVKAAIKAGTSNNGKEISEKIAYGNLSQEEVTQIEGLLED